MINDHPHPRAITSLQQGTYFYGSEVFLSRIQCETLHKENYKISKLMCIVMQNE